METIAVPLLVIDSEGWISVFESEALAGATLEAPDVEAGEYLAFDANGVRIHLDTRNDEIENASWWRKIRQQTPIRLRASGDIEHDVLRDILIEALGVEDDSTYRLPDLFEMAASIPARRLRAPKTVERIRGTPNDSTYD